MKNEIFKLKEDFRKAKTADEKAEIDDKIKELVGRNPDEFANAMIESAKITAEKADTLAIKIKMEEVLPAISTAYIAKKYFNKTSAWLYQRINGNVVNGKNAEFSKQELDTMRFALQDLSCKLSRLSVSL